MGTAALLAFSACSSDDEPATTGPTPDGADANMYLAVNIATAGNGRAEGDYLVGSEHEVSTADFFFFDEDGHYVTKGNVWNNGDASTGNVEFKSKNLVVLKGLKEKKLPKYVVTVLNAPDDLAAKVENERPSLKELGALSFNYLNGSNYIMTTSSYYDGDAAKHDKFYNATYIEDGKLIPEAQLPSMDATDKISTDKLVEIYVERLAAKYSLDDASKNIKSTLEITISGSDNKDGSDDTAAGDAETATKIEITVTGFGVTNTEAKSYLSKNIDGWSSTVSPSTAWAADKWNVSGDFRSHWAKSINYDNAETKDFVTNTFKQVVGKYDAYSNETTKALANLYVEESNTLNPQKTPCFVITAEAKISNDAKTLVEYNGLYYYENSFKNYVLDKLNRTDKLNFYKLVNASTVTKEDEKKTVTIEGKTYKQIGADDIKFNRANPDVKNNQVVLIYDDTKSDKPEGDKPEAEKLYAKITVGAR